MLKTLVLALTLLISAPFVAHAGEITLLPSVKLHIGDRDYSGNYWDGGKWLNKKSWHDNYRWHNNGWHRHDRDWKRGKGKDHKSYMRGYRDGLHDRKDFKKKHHRH